MSLKEKLAERRRRLSARNIPIQLPVPSSTGNMDLEFALAPISHPEELHMPLLFNDEHKLEESRQEEPQQLR